jgi:hypothetical protein
MSKNSHKYKSISKYKPNIFDINLSTDISGVRGHTYIWSDLSYMSGVRCVIHVWSEVLQVTHNRSGVGCGFWGIGNPDVLISLVWEVGI